MTSFLQIFIFGVTDRDHEDFEKFHEAGATSVLHKPFTMPFFLEFLKQMDVLCENDKEQRQREEEQRLINKLGNPLHVVQQPSCPP